MQTVYTIGYEGLEIDVFIFALKSVGVKTLADVRALALSRKKGFSKTALKSRLEQEGISYTHFNSLGDPKPGRDAARAGKFDEFREIYTIHLATSGPQAALQDRKNLVKDAPTCLLCFEREPSYCHRRIISDRLKANEIKVIDLFGKDPACHVSLNSKPTNCNAGKGDAESELQIW